MIHRMYRLTIISLGLLTGALAACGGATETEVDDDDLEISDLDSALTSPDPGDDGDDGSDCRDDDDQRGHKHHRRHKFKILDRLDGARDKTITLATLPPGLPERLLARLRAIDLDGNGLVTKDEAKAAWFHHKGKHDRRGKKDKHDRRD